MKKLKATILALIIVLSSLCLTAWRVNAAEEIPPIDPGDEKFPIVDEPIQLKMIARQTDLQSEYNDMWFWQAYAELSNIQVDFECIAATNLAEKRNLAVLSADQPDAYLRCSFPTNDLVKYSEDGLFVRLDDKFDDYAPDFAAYLDKYPDIRQGITMPDGHIYSTCYVKDHPAVSTGSRYWFSGEALDMVGKEVPETIDELTDVLRAFKDCDVNGNGEADEIPLTGPGIDVVMAPLQGSWGLANRGAASIFDIDPETGDYRYFPASDQYRDFLEYVHMLYSEELIDQDIFTATTADLVAKGTEGRALTYSFVNHSIIGSLSENSRGMVKPFTGPEGDELWGAQGSNLTAPGAFVITDVNEYPEETLQWINFLYTKPGMEAFFMGIKGDSYEDDSATYYQDEDGNYEYTKYVMENPDGRMFEEVLGNVVPWAGGGNPSAATEEFFKGGEMQSITREAADRLSPYAPETIWPNIVYDSSVVDEVSQIANDISTFMVESRANFITGNVEINDETWNEYIEGLKSFGLERYLEIFAETAERYDLQ